MTNYCESNESIANAIKLYTDEQSEIIREILDDQGNERVRVGSIVRIKSKEIMDRLMMAAYSWYNSNLPTKRKGHLTQRALIGQLMPEYVYGIVESLELHDPLLGGGCNRFHIDWFLENVLKGWDSTMNPIHGIWEFRLTLVRLPENDRPFDCDELTTKFKFDPLSGRWMKAICEYCCTYYCLRMMYYDNVYELFKNVRQYEDVTNIGRKTILQRNYTRYTDNHESVCIECCIEDEFATGGTNEVIAQLAYVSDVE